MNERSRSLHQVITRLFHAVAGRSVRSRFLHGLAYIERPVFAATSISKGGRQAGVIVVAVALQGCSGLTHYNDVSSVRTADGGKTELLLMDAKQRIVYPTTHRVRDANGKVVEIFRAFCAEPSPDALSALAAQFGASVSIDTKADVSANGGFAESAANIGLRTASSRPCVTACTGNAKPSPTAACPG